MRTHDDDDDGSDDEDDDDNNDGVAQDGGHTPNGRLTETFSLGFNTVYFFDI